MTSTLNNIIERRVRNEASKQAQAEVAAIEAMVRDSLDKIGVDEFMVPLYQMTNAVRDCRVEVLVHARLQALADQMLTPAKGIEAQAVSALNDATDAMRKLTEQHVAKTKQLLEVLEQVTDGGNAMRTAPL